jgi:hypothetical protein
LFVTKVKDALSEYGVNSGSLLEERVQFIFQEFYKKMELALGRFDGLVDRVQEVVNERVEDYSGYQLNMYGGKFHRVPSTWKFPKCGVHDVWRQWWIGDTVLQVPPLKLISIVDVKHLDDVPLTEIELVRKVGLNKNNRRKATKELTDLRFLCNYLTDLVTKLGKLEDVINLPAVDWMFVAVAEVAISGERDNQKGWLSVVRELRQKNTIINITTINNTNIINNVVNVAANVNTNVPTNNNANVDVPTNNTTNVATNITTDVATNNTTDVANNNTTSVTTNNTTSVTTNNNTNVTTNISTN